MRTGKIVTVKTLFQLITAFYRLMMMKENKMFLGSYNSGTWRMKYIGNHGNLLPSTPDTYDVYDVCENICAN